MGYENIPPQLRALPQWVCWGVPGRPQKAPVNPAGGMARAGYAGTWGSFAAALELVQARRAQGLGFEFEAGGGLVGVDFDRCIQDGRLLPFAAKWVAALDSYTEISPSGTGLHVICRGQLPGPAIKRPVGEMYDRARYFTVTGNVWPAGGAARPLRDAQPEIAALYAALQEDAASARQRAAVAPSGPPRHQCPPDPAAHTHAAQAPPAAASEPAAAAPSDGAALAGPGPQAPPAQSPAAQRPANAPVCRAGPEDILTAALAKDPRFAALWYGQRPNGNESADDLGLCNKLAFYLDGDAAQLQAAFLASPHFATKDAAHRKKADPASRGDYLPRTIRRALDDRQAQRRADLAPSVPLDWTDAIGVQDRPPAPADGAPAAASAAPPAAVPRTTQPRLVLTPMSDVETRHPRYLVTPYLPRGMLSILGGVSGVGKTWLVLSWAAAISAGRKLPFLDPFSPPPDPGNVLYFTQENDPHAVLRPRLDTLDADLARIFIQTQPEGAPYTPLTLNDPRLEYAAKDKPPALVVFDPIQSYLGAKVEMNKANEVRPVLDWLADFAKRHDCAVLLVSHMSKPGLGNAAALDRLLGSSDFRNAARSIVIVGRDPEDRESRVFAHGKNSLGVPGDSWRYHIDSDSGVVYDERCELDVDDIISSRQSAPQKAQTAPLLEAMRQLQELAEPEGGTTVEKATTLQILSGWSERTLYRAKKELGLKSLRIGPPSERTTWWLLPDTDVARFKLDHGPKPEQTTMQ